jgi:hypothetical protein
MIPHRDYSVEGDRAHAVKYCRECHRAGAEDTCAFCTELLCPRCTVIVDDLPYCESCGMARFRERCHDRLDAELDALLKDYEFARLERELREGLRLREMVGRRLREFVA